MRLTLRESFQILPGVKLNINRKSWSVTFDSRNGGPNYTRSSTGTRTTSMDLPGPFGYRHTSRRGRRTRRRED
ncbi:DUF4236 domain-containing protein [Streptomyces nanshensis]|uniref:DUF4236 domain-containing protein n=1 Tax=Streptomyces nanshensis TaxID=518642 RepID=A0A1E7L347_9ACTN|nr:DUF4236 domain-containing protein [Streptomyces nanshensis]OEV10551.1 hypothetical protein AN218_16975 [Streptomyces nanshensis]